MDLKMFNAIVDNMSAQSGCTRDYRTLAEAWLKRVESCAAQAGYTICDLKPLAELLGCDPEMGALTDAVRKLRAKFDRAFVSGMNAKTRGSILGKSALSAIAQALNWERTEFDTLDELLDELRASEEAHSKFVDCAIRDRAFLGTLRDKVLAADGAGDMAWAFAIQEVGQILLDSCEQQTHAVLHGTEYYPDSTILLQTAQLVAWRDADGQEHCERAHRVTLNPDRDGLAAAILSGIAGAQIAPEHIAELRAQMGGDIHG